MKAVVAVLAIPVITAVMFFTGLQVLDRLEVHRDKQEFKDIVQSMDLFEECSWRFDALFSNKSMLLICRNKGTDFDNLKLTDHTVKLLRIEAIYGVKDELTINQRIQAMKIGMFK